QRFLVVGRFDVKVVHLIMEKQFDILGIQMARKIAASNHITCSSRKLDQVAYVFETVIRTALIDADSNRKHEKGLSWLTPVEYVGSFINESFRVAKCAVPLLKDSFTIFH
uniref:Uncharacterized protein n=1 Tax=Parascaris univalens TaxID=6257 RepID=A0A915BZC9_PARUN